MCVPAGVKKLKDLCHSQLYQLSSRLTSIFTSSTMTDLRKDNIFWHAQVLHRIGLIHTICNGSWRVFYIICIRQHVSRIDVIRLLLLRASLGNNCCMQHDCNATQIDKSGIFLSVLFCINAPFI